MFFELVRSLLPWLLLLLAATRVPDFRPAKDEPLDGKDVDKLLRDLRAEYNNKKAS